MMATTLMSTVGICKKTVTITISSRSYQIGGPTFPYNSSFRNVIAIFCTTNERIPSLPTHRHKCDVNVELRLTC